MCSNYYVIKIFFFIYKTTILQLNKKGYNTIYWLKCEIKKPHVIKWARNEIDIIHRFIDNIMMFSTFTLKAIIKLNMAFYESFIYLSDKQYNCGIILFVFLRRLVMTSLIWTRIYWWKWFSYNHFRLIKVYKYQKMITDQQNNDNKKKY